MNSCRLIICLVLLLIGSVAVPVSVAQTPSLEVYSAGQGLPQGQVLALHRDPEGFLWVGTYGGLSRYDGRGFVTWTAAEGLPTNTVSDLTTDARGRLVVATSKGVCFLRKPALAGGAGVGGEVTCPVDAREPVEVGMVWADTSQGGSGEVWAATEGGVALYVDDSIHHFDRSHGLPSDRVSTVAFHEGQLYVGTEAGAAVYLPGGDIGRFEPVDLGDLSTMAVTAMASSPTGLLIAGEGKIVAKREEDFRAELLPSDLEGATIARLVPTSAGGTWIATSRGVAHWQDTPLAEASILDRRRGLPAARVYSLIVDQENIVWIGTDGGIAKRAPGPFSTFSVADGVPDVLVRAMAERPVAESAVAAELWLGTREGVVRQRGARFEKVELSDLKHPRVYALTPGTLGEMWIGTVEGLVRWFPDRQQRFGEAEGLPQDFVLALLPQTVGPSPNNRGVWVGTRRGLVFVDETGLVKTFDHPIGQAPVLSLIKGHDDALWVGMNAGGVQILDWRAGPDGPEIEGVRLHGSEANGWTGLSIWSMDRSLDGKVWLGTNGDGVLGVTLRGATAEVERLTVDNGLINNFVWQVASDSAGSLWMFTNQGLDRYFPDRAGADRFRHFGLADGLPSLEGAAAAILEDHRGRLWFGTSEGVVRFDPDRESGNPLPPRVLIREVVTDDGQKLSSGAVLGPELSSLTVRVTALSFRREDRVRFRYRLMGGDDRWSQFIAEDTINFVGIGAGNYSLEVEAVNESGVLSATPAVFELVVRPGFWGHWEVRLLGAFLLMAGVFALARFRVRHLEGERRRLESLVAARTLELQRQNQSLAKEIDERIKAEEEHRRLEDQLRQSEKMEAVGRLAGGVAHDFNNLLTTISGYCDLLGEQLERDDPKYADLKEIQRASQRAARLTHQLLAFSRKQDIAPTILHLNAVVGEVSRMLERLIGEHIRLRFDLDAQPDVVVCDRGQLEQILMNLVLNARDSVGSRGSISIQTRYEVLGQDLENRYGEPVPAGAYVVLEVLDTGHGMDDEVLSRIFEPFFTTKAEGEGTGLGLATVYGAVSQNKGFVDVESAVGRGTQFRVRFPAAVDQAVDTVATGVFEAVPEGMGYTVLVVEDEDAVRALISGILSRFGYRVLQAAHGQEAIRVSESFEGRIHLLLTDMVMPELDGRMLAERLASPRPEMEVLFVSGYPDDYLSRRGLLPEGKSFLNKPFSSKRLARTVRQALGNEAVS